MVRVIIILLFFTSCITEQKVRNWNNNHAFAAAEYCDENFPFKTDTVIKHSKPVLRTDTLIQYDSLPCPPNLSDTQYFPIKNIIHIRDSIFIRDTLKITGESSAQKEIIKGLKDQLLVITSDRDRLKGSRKKWIQFGVGMILVFGIGIFLKIKNVL